MNDTGATAPNRHIVLNTLAGAGFIALVGAGIWLAIYSTRFVPGIVNRAGSAAVYLGSLFTPAEEPTLSVVPTPTASTTISFLEASSTISHSADSVTPPPAKTSTKPAAPTAGEQTSTTQQIGGSAAPATLTGLPDLTVHITAVGYLATTSAESFIASSTVPSGFRPAVRFTILNAGTNTAGPWRFNASIPTQNAYIYQSQVQQPLNPGDSIEYTLGFDQANKGIGQTISISANFDRAVTESNTENNNASTKITVLGN